MLRKLFCTFLVAAACPGVAQAQVQLVPSDRAPYQQKFDLEATDAQYLFVPQSSVPLGGGAYRFRFEHPALNEALENPATVRYFTARDAGFQLQLYHLRARGTPADALGPQAFEVADSAGAVVGRGRILVLGRRPEAVSLAGEDGHRVFEVGRFADVRLEIRTHGNYRGGLRVVNARDYELSGLRETPEDSAGVVVVNGRLRPLRREAGDLKLSAETVDGRAVELAFTGLDVRAPAPRRVRVAGGPVFLDALGRGVARLTISGFASSVLATPELSLDTSGDLEATAQEYDAERGELRVQVELLPRGTRAPGAREVRELTVRAGAQTYRGFVEVVGTPVVSGVRAEASGKAVLLAGNAPTLLRISGQNLEGLRLDCAPLGQGSTCKSISSTPTELVVEVSLGAEARDGEVTLPLVATGERRVPEGPLFPGGGVRVQVERPAIPLLLAMPGLIELNCSTLRSCRLGSGGESLTVNARDAQMLRLAVDDNRIPTEHGWQNLAITVTRVRGEQRQVVRALGSSAAPRTFRRGLSVGALTLLDATADPRHGDLFIVRVEHVPERYPAEHRNEVSASEPFVRRIYIDGGAHRRLTGDVAVQPVLFSFDHGGMTPLYPNAGLGLTWQFLNERLEPSAFSAKFQVLGTNLRGGTEESAMRPALLLSGNLRIPGTDPSKPLVITTGVAHMLGGEHRWRILAGAGIDLGVARLIFGG